MSTKRISTRTHKIIEQLLDKLDWERVKTTMEALDWKYMDLDDELVRPTFSQLRSAAKRNLAVAATSEEHPCSSSCGGFLATAQSSVDLDLYFVATSVSSEDIE